MRRGTSPLERPCEARIGTPKITTSAPPVTALTALRAEAVRRSHPGNRKKPFAAGEGVS
jgi:hypothetical protein